MENPKKIMRNDAHQWTTDFDLNIQNLKYVKELTSHDEFAVAANVTDFTMSTGTKWSTAGMANSLTPKENGFCFYPDHTYGTNDYGGMLFCDLGDIAPEPLFSKKINGLKSGYYRANSYMNSFRDNYPIAFHLKITDLSTGKFVESDSVSKTDEGLDWVKAQCELNLEGDSLLLEVYYDMHEGLGNDFVLDDIQLWSLFVPSTSGDTIPVEDTIPSLTLEIGYDNDTIAIFTRLSEMVGLGENVGILYQYSLTPEESSSWRSFVLSEKLMSAGVDAMTELMEKLTGEGQSDSVDLYVRLVVGPVTLLSETDEYLSDDPSYVVSNVVRLPLCIAPSEAPFISTEIEPGKFVVTWERFEEASSYVLTIFTDTTMQDTVAIYEFDEQGELIRMNKLRAESESEVMGYTVTNLKTGSYYYVMEAKKGAAVVAKNSASFMMPEKVSCESAKSDAWMVYVDESALNVFAPEAGTIKVTDVCGNLVGAFSVEAGATSGIALPAGVYFVTLNAEVRKVLVY